MVGYPIDLQDIGPLVPELVINLHRGPRKKRSRTPGSPDYRARLFGAKPTQLCLISKAQRTDPFDMMLYRGKWLGNAKESVGATVPYKAIFLGHIPWNLALHRYLQSIGPWNGHWKSWVQTLTKTTKSMGTSMELHQVVWNQHCYDDWSPWFMIRRFLVVCFTRQMIKGSWDIYLYNAWKYMEMSIDRWDNMTRHKNGCKINHNEIINEKIMRIPIRN